MLKRKKCQALGVDTMSTLESNIALLSTIPEEFQGTIHTYLVNLCADNPFKPMSANEILEELAESRACYERGEFQDFDEVLDEISDKYGI